MNLIAQKQELHENITRLKQYVADAGPDHDFALDVIRNGICFVITQENGKPFFAPSRFIGYKANSRHAHLDNEDKDGRETNEAIANILGSTPEPSARLQEEYERFCSSLAINIRKAPFGIERKFWDLR